ncbi:DUF1611 domain-containing protein [Synechococcus sp. CBW1004]|jgi:uncharacterized NAD-dependent epimerase/dehydratase family protein|uniref:DUF1611 domain-containing protein n=1 Tax=Synechococcus sp. CBW1004 TaxID=1353136 RepID=UPI0018CF8EE6|nr:DUF1611 domain-containing protein [Synechococcus sp. CBW1004]QPN64688.1 DUF1611 domain-containing protein [Synechococcus sp. CBW1004]
MLTPDTPVVLLQHGGLDNLSGKTGLAMLRHRGGPIVAVIDPAHAGADLRAVTGIDRDVPVVADMTAALACGPKAAVVGLAPSGGRLPEEMEADVLLALEAGLNLASGLHSRLADDPRFAAACRRPGQWIWDLRREPEGLEVATARCAALPCRRLLAVGSDMAVGKMSACLELAAAALQRGLDARFVGTGQAGILISGQGVALDAVRVDYAAGAVEAAVLQAAEGAGPGTLMLVEGQGSLCHPGSTATLPLLRGSQPTDLLLVHRAGQSQVRTRPGAAPVAIPPLPEVIAALEAVAAQGRPDGVRPRVKAVALNTALLSDAAAEAAIQQTVELTGLPCGDPVRQGGDGLLAALVGAFA